MKHYTLLLTTPLLFLACNSTPKTTSQTTVSEKSQTIEETTTQTVPSVVTSTEQPVIESTTMSSNEVNYANENKKIKSLGNLHIKSFMQTMKPTLMGLMQSDPTHKTALGACSTLGQGMVNDYNNLSEVKVRRTALKYRNPQNQPDATDTMVMERFLASNDFKESLVVDMGDHFRVYKALDVKPACLACHGTNISKDLKQMIISKYPTDMATEFQVGDFRGVVVAKVQK